MKNVDLQKILYMNTLIAHQRTHLHNLQRS